MTRLYDALGYILPCASCGAVHAEWIKVLTASGAIRYVCTRCYERCSAARALSTHEVTAGRWPAQIDPWTPPEPTEDEVGCL